MHGIKHYGYLLERLDRELGIAKDHIHQDCTLECEDVEKVLLLSKSIYYLTKIEKMRAEMEVATSTVDKLHYKEATSRV